MSDHLFSVEKHVVLVSGGSRGIGRALAGGFKERGATVIVTGRDTVKLHETAMQHNVETRTCDVADIDSIRACVDSVIEEYGHIDTLLNVAGVNRRMRSEDYTPEDYDFIVDINMKGAFFMSTEVGRHMLAAKSGSVINIDSLNTYQPLKGVVPYAMSKSGMVAMTRGMALEWGERGVRVNSIAPGWIVTDLTRGFFEEEKFKTWFMAHTPMKRMGAVEDLIGAAIYLASGASGWMTGQVMRIDGGASCGFEWPIEL